MVSIFEKTEKESFHIAGKVNFSGVAFPRNLQIIAFGIHISQKSGHSDESFRRSGGPFPPQSSCCVQCPTPKVSRHIYEM
jgi:hypothetical protein